MSAVIAGQINDDDDDNEIENEFPCPKVSGDILQKVVDYCTHYQEEPMEKIETPLQGETIEAIVKPEWYVRFCDVDREIMFQLVAAANFLNIKPLLDLTCLAVSVSIKGHSVEELREIIRHPVPDSASPSVVNETNASTTQTIRNSSNSYNYNDNSSDNNISKDDNNDDDNNSSKKRSHSIANLKDYNHEDRKNSKPRTRTGDHHQPSTGPAAVDGNIDQSWEEKMLKQIPRCCPAPGIEETSVFYHKQQQQQQYQGGGGNYLRVLLTELSNLSESLPQSPAIWVRFDEDSPQYIRILMVGPQNTPYTHGLFCFDLYVPCNYPKSPPQMKLLTTGYGTVRFSPNLYANGMVCLSLLNTWDGPKWQAHESTILQVLVSIQALVLGTEHPYYLEPGRGGWEEVVKKSQQQQDSAVVVDQKVPRCVQMYEDRIREGTLQYALLDMLRAVCPQNGGGNGGSSGGGDCSGGTNSSSTKYKYLQCFQDIIQAHFYHYKDEMVETVQQWSELWNEYSMPKNKLDKYVKEFHDVLSRELRFFAFMDQAMTTTATAASLKEQHDDDGLQSMTPSSRMEQAVAKGDYMTIAHLSLERIHAQKYGNVASKLATKRQEMEQRASLKDYIGAGAIQMEVQFLEQNQKLLCDLEKRMLEAASKLDFVKASKIQQQYQTLIGSGSASGSASASGSNGNKNGVASKGADRSSLSILDPVNYSMANGLKVRYFPPAMDDFVDDEYYDEDEDDEVERYDY